jgi:hypothetical protein
MTDQWALRRALKQERTLYDPRRRVRLDLDEVAHPADVAARWRIYQPWPAWYEDLAGIGVVFRPKSVLEIGVRLGYSGFCLCSGSLLAGVRRVRFTGLDLEVDEGPPLWGYRTLAQAAETFRRFLPQVKGSFLPWDTRDGLPAEGLSRRFDLVHVDGDPTQEGTLGDLRAAWCVLGPGGILIASRTRAMPKAQAVGTFLGWLVDQGAAFESQSVHNDEGIVLFRKGDQ